MVVDGQGWRRIKMRTKKMMWRKVESCQSPKLLSHIIKVTDRLKWMKEETKLG
jgi:DUF438 domain-containing protein